MTTKLKLILGGIVSLAIILALGFGIYHIKSVFDQRDALLATNAVLTKSNHDLKTQLDLKPKQADISHQASQNTIDQVQANHHKMDAIDVSIGKQAQVIIHKYDALPKTDANATAKDEELSALNLKSLWMTFCSLGNTNERCKDYLPQ